MVLLRNDGVLPLATSTGKIAVIGPLGQATYDSTAPGPGGVPGRPPSPPVTVVDGIKAASSATVTFTKGCEVNGTDTSGSRRAQDARRAADVAVLVLGESADLSARPRPAASSTCPASSSNSWPRSKDTGTPFVVVLVNGGR